VLLRRSGKAGEDRMALFGALALAASFLVAAARHELAPPPARALAAAAWVGFGPMAIAFLCWDRAMAEGSASRIGALSYLDPLLSTLCVSFALDKPLTAASLGGMALIIGGAAVPALRRKG
jgi:drug/metabolite transporter (DMT)-like permease